jgi:Predicted transcription factor, homolog of eukaryotic MBF1
MSFAEAVTALRTKAGMTKTQLAYHARISASMMDKLESGDRDPSPTVAVRITHALKLPQDEAMHLLAIAGYASETWRERASEGLRSYLRDSPTPEPTAQN